MVCWIYVSMVPARTSAWPAAPTRPAATPTLVAAPAVVVSNEWTQADLVNPARKLSFYLAVVLMFLRFSMLHQYASWIVHHNLYLLYLFAPPALLGVVITGGFRRTFSGRAGKWWTAYGLWLVATIPFSSWRGGSFHQVENYMKADYPILFILAGLALTWKECRLLLGAGALGAVFNLACGRMFQHETTGERMDLSLGAVSNSNDYAAHLILAMSFLLFVALCRDKSKIARLGATACVGLSVVFVFRTASRGGLIALVVIILIYMAYSSMTQRMAMLMGAPILLAIVLSTVPKAALQRITSFSAESQDASAEALESQASRRYLLRKSLEYTFTHPLFGVGPGQFSAYEGSHNKIIGTHGSWHETHNTFTQVSAETGLPGFVMFAGGMLITLGTFRKIHAKARHRPECQDIAAASLAMLLGFAGFMSAVTFLSFGYFFYFPAMGGLAVAMARGAEFEFKSRRPTLQPYVLQPYGAR